MSLAPQLTRTLIAAFVACLLIGGMVNRAAAQDAPQVEQQPTSEIHGVVTYADTGRPLRYSYVNLIRNDNGVYQKSEVIDGRGRFVMTGVAAGHYLIHVDAPGILRPGPYEQKMGSVAAQLRVNGTRDLFSEVVVNGTDNVDVKVQAVRGGVITGRVLDEDDQPVGEADVKLLKLENGKWVAVESTWREIRGKPLQTDLSGVYRIAGLASGEYAVRVSEPDAGSDEIAPGDEAYSNGSQMVVYHPAATTLKEAQTVSVSEGSDTTGIDVRIPDRIPRTISGTLTVGPDKQPARSAEIRIERVDEAGLLVAMEATTRPDLEGKWELRGIPAGEYRITFSGSVRLGSQESGGWYNAAPKEVSFSIANEDVVLNESLSFGATVLGTVKVDGAATDDMDGTFVGVVSAGASTRPPGVDRNSFARNFSSGYLRDKGKFRIDGLSAGKYWVVLRGIDSEKYYVKSVTRKGVDLGQKPFTINAGAVFDEVLVTLGIDLATIEGALSETKPKTSPTNAVVILAPANDATRRFSRGLVMSQPDAQGKFSFQCGPGEYFVTALTRAEIEKLKTPITEDYFKQDNQKFVRVKVAAGEKLKGVALPLGAR